MKRFLVPSSRGPRPAGASDSESPSERASRLAATLGLAWPWKGPQGPGRPNLQTVYERTLAQLLQRREWAALEGVTTKEVPPAWREGLPVGTKFEEYLRTEAAHMLAHKASSSSPAAAAAAPDTAAEEEEVEEGEAEEEQEDTQEPAAKKRKTTRPKGFVPPDAVEWFVEWSQAMRAKHKTPVVTSWRKARALCPQIFGHVHFSTYRGWKDRPRPNYSSGRRKRLSPLQESSLSALAFSLSKQDVPYTLEMFVTLARKKLSLKVSRSWCYRFLKGLRLRWKSMKQGGAAKAFSESETKHLQYMLSAKMWWLIHQKGVAPTRLFNMDETSLSLLPLAAKGWKPAGQAKHKDEADESVTVPDDKAAITCSLVFGFGENSPAFAQLIYTGKTAASHPVAPSPAHILVDHTDTHWQSTETLLRLLGWLEQQIGSQEPWGLLLDVAPVHVAEAFVSAAKEQFPQCQLIFVRAGTTSICQPCDISYIRAFKSVVRRSFAECFAEQVLEGSSELGELFKKPNLKGMIPHLVAAAVRQINTEEHRQQAWKHLVPDDMPTLLQEAQMLQDYGALFEGGDEKEAEEEEEEDPWQEDDGAEAAEPDSGEEDDPEDIQEDAPEAAPAEAEAAAEAVLSKSAARLLALRVVYGSKPATEPEARALSAHMRWPRGRAPGQHHKQTLSIPEGSLWLCSPTSLGALPR